MKQVAGSEGIGELWVVLKHAQLELDAEEIADLLWLAVQMGEVEVTSGSKLGGSLLDTSDKYKNSAQPKSQPDENLESTPPEISVNLPNESDDKSQSQTASEGISFKAPAAPGLRNKLALGRALRPLMRKVSSRTKKILDVEETVTQFAENRILIPKFKPEPERWLDLALVVEKSPSIIIWQEIITEFQKFIELSGAFRSVSTWGLQTDDKGDIKLFPQPNRSKHQQSSHSPQELLDSAGRRLILFVSDCTSQIWYRNENHKNSKIHQTLELWSNYGCLAIVQLFPERLWTRTVMGFGYPVLLNALEPGVPNKKLTVEGLPVWEDVDVSKSITLPVITLDPDSVKQWSRVVAGFGSTQTAGILFDPDLIPKKSEISPKDTDNTDRKLSAKDLVNRFRATASPTARRLAGLMATVPVSLPVVHLIQQTILKESMQVHVAEVFMSGLLKPVQKNTTTKEGIVNYDFVEGVRELLIDSVPTPDVDKVLHEVSQYIAKKAGISIKNFAALLLLPPDPELDDKTKQDSSIQSFAKITTDVLKRLGGEYADFAEYLEEKSSNYHKNKVSDVPNSQGIFKGQLLQLIERAATEGWTELDLAGQKLTALPPEIGKLTQLKKLILGKYKYNEDRDIVGTIGSQLSDLPPEIGLLNQLEELQIVGNKLSSLPAEIKKLTKLKKLTLVLDYRQLETLLAGRKWKQADDETLRIMKLAVVRVEPEDYLTKEDFESFPCDVLHHIDRLWTKYSKNHFGFSVQKQIWQSAEINYDFFKFMICLGWGGKGTASKYVFWEINSVDFDISAPRGLLPLAVTYYGGNVETRKKYISRLVFCFSEYPNPTAPTLDLDYRQLETLLAGRKWKQADDETLRIMKLAVGRVEPEDYLTKEDFESFSCDVLHHIDRLWTKYSKNRFGFSVQKEIWQSAEINDDFFEFMTRLGWGRKETPSKYVFWGINLVDFDFSAPRGLLPLAVTYYGGNLETRKKYISMLVFCFSEYPNPTTPEVSQETIKPNTTSSTFQKTRIENLKQDLEKLSKDYQVVADKKRRESNPVEINNLQLQLDYILKDIEAIEQQLRKLGYEFD